MKGLGKAISRTPFNVTSRIGMSKKSTDPEFDEYNRNFAALEQGAEKLLKDTKLFIDNVNLLFASTASAGTHFSTTFEPLSAEYDLIGKHPEAEHSIRSVTKYATAMEEMKALVSPELDLIESRIIGPTKELQAVLKTIRKTITKREHKLVDYDRYNNSLTKLRDKKEKSLNDEKNLFKLEQDFELATNEYEYINSALKQDFPRFMQLSTQFIDPLFNSLFYMQLNIYYLIMEKMNSFAEDAKYDIGNVPGPQIQQEYEEKRTNAWELIENMNIVKRIISVSKLVQASRANNNVQRMQTTASASSSSSRLAPPPSAGSFKKSPPPPPPSLSSKAAAAAAPPPPYTPSSGAVGGGIERSTSSASSASAASAAAVKRAPPPPPPLKPKPKIVPQPVYVIALYDFDAQAEGDLSFRTGDRIEIVERSGSAEDWWTGRLATGEQGVFPGNYVRDA